MRTIKKIIIHCSDSAFGNRDVIDVWHKARKWKGIGYHYVICNGYPATAMTYAADWDGRIEEGRPVSEAGAHVKGHNADSIGICLIGKAQNQFTPLQIKRLTALIEVLRGQYAIPLAQIYGHRDFDEGKTCPNFSVSQFLGV